MTCREQYKHIVHNPADQNMPRTPDATRAHPVSRMPEMVMDETVDDLDAQTAWIVSQIVDCLFDKSLIPITGIRPPEILPGP